MNSWSVVIACFLCLGTCTTGFSNPYVLPRQQLTIRRHPSRLAMDRFEQTADLVAGIEEPCILRIDGVSYNVTSWAKRHPGGVAVLQAYHDKDATAAFSAVGHSKRAREMLQDFAIPASNDDSLLSSTSSTSSQVVHSKRPRWIQKLFTKEDPIGLHKTLGVFVLLHFVFRYGQMYFGDITAGLGSRMGRGPSRMAPIFLLPHAALSLSSLLFHNVPRERVVGKPMIWQENRIHSIVFGLRSVITTLLAWLMIYNGNTRSWRRIAVTGSCLVTLATQLAADEATRRLRMDSGQSTTATMPYWEGCSLQTQKRFKSFYAYAQFLATLACIAVTNPVIPFAVLMPIQLSSFLMTLSRKGFLSTRGSHMIYTASLVVPFFVALRNVLYTKTWDFPIIVMLGWILFQLRCRGVNKYALWLPIYASRIAVGDQFLTWNVY